MMIATISHKEVPYYLMLESFTLERDAKLENTRNDDCTQFGARKMFLTFQMVCISLSRKLDKSYGSEANKTLEQYDLRFHRNTVRLIILNSDE